MPSGRKGRRQTPRQEWQPLNMERLASMPRTVERHGVDYTVSRISGSEKSYICPGCNHPIAPRTPHVVVWAADNGYAPFGMDTGVGARRHWHSRCWGS